MKQRKTKKVGAQRIASTPWMKSCENRAYGTSRGGVGGVGAGSGTGFNCNYNDRGFYHY